jgi:hypothetical protein
MIFIKFSNDFYKDESKLRETNKLINKVVRIQGEYIILEIIFIIYMQINFCKLI